MFTLLTDWCYCARINCSNVTNYPHNHSSTLLLPHSPTIRTWGEWSLNLDSDHSTPLHSTPPQTFKRLHDFFNLINYLTFKRLHDFFLLEPLKNRFGDIITHYLVPFGGWGWGWGWHLTPTQSNYSVTWHVWAAVHSGRVLINSPTICTLPHYPHMGSWSLK